MRNVLEQFLDHYLCERDMERVLEMVSDQIVSVGTGAKEVAHNKQELRALLMEELAQNDRPMQYEISDYREQELAPGAGCTFCRLTARLCDENGVYTNFETRFSTALSRVDGVWKFSSFHMSAPTVLQTEEEFFPLTYGLETRSRINAQAKKDVMELMAGMIPGGFLGVYLEPGLPLFAINEEMMRCIGYASYDELVEGTGGLMETALHPADAEKAKGAMESVLQGTETYSVTYRMKKKDGQYIWVLDKGKKYVTDDGRIAVISVVMDISKNVELQEKLKMEATQDPLTHIYNRREGYRLIEKTLVSNGSGALFVMDLDNFKSVNDRYGHQAGDEVLVDFARILKDTAGARNIPARLGGDEFILYFPGATNANMLMRRAKILCSSFRAIEERRFGISDVSLSVGICIHHRGESFSTLYAKADHTLHQAKADGKGEVRVCAC